MTNDADTIAPRPSLVCDIVCGEALESHIEAFRAWAGLLWDLSMEALLSSGTIERAEEVYDRPLWEGVVGVGEKHRTRRLSAKALSGILAGDDL